MGVKVTANISILVDGRCWFGQLRQVAGERLAFRSDGWFTEGTSLEFQLDEEGRDEVVRGVAQVRLAARCPGELNKFVVGITSISDADRERLDQWVAERADQEPPDSRPSQSSIAPSHPPARTVAPAPDAYDSSLVREPGRDVGRAAIREVLRSRVGRSAPTSTSSDGPARPHGPDPEILCLFDVEPLRLGVRYRSPATFARDYNNYLRNSALFLPVLRLRLDTGSIVDLRIRLPDGQKLQCTAHVVVCLSSGLGLSLTLDEHARQLITQAAMS